jgi:hypothetical protein
MFRSNPGNVPQRARKHAMDVPGFSPIILLTPQVMRQDIDFAM